MRFHTSNLLLLSEEAVRERALELVAGVEPKGKSAKWQEEEFHALFGSPSKLCSLQWNDLCLTDIPEAKLKPAKMSKAGFKCFMMAHFFLWQKPRNACTFGSQFGVCEKLKRGYPIWKWVLDKIGALHKKVIFWPKDLDSANTATQILSVDGVDFRHGNRSNIHYSTLTQKIVLTSTTMLQQNMKSHCICLNLSAFGSMAHFEEESMTLISFGRD